MKVIVCRSLFLALLLFGFSKSGHALIGAQAMIGTDESKLKDIGLGFKDQTLKGNAAGVAVHLDPIPLVPVGFGIGITSPTSKATVNGADLTLTGVSVDLEIMAWTPISLFGITPFVKLGFIPYSAYTLEGTFEQLGVSVSGKAPISGSGNHFAVGATFSLIPLVSLMAQISTHSETLKYEKFKAAGIEFDVDKKISKSTTNLLVGVEVGI